jgi:hypothetical protein
MKTINSYEGLVRTNAYDVNGDKIGRIDAVYYDEQTGRPEWLAIRTGFFGTKTSFAPVTGATARDGKPYLPYTKDHIKDAPNVDLDGYLTPEEERELFAHYGFDWDARRYGTDAPRFDADDEVATQPSEVAETTRS